MHLSAPWYPLEQELAQRFPHLRPAQQYGLCAWTVGTVLADSACEAAVVLALQRQTEDGQRVPAENTLREGLREWLRDGAQKSAPCRTELDVTTCFVPLVRWVLDLLVGQEVALAFDATNFQDRCTALVVSVVYRGHAIPVAWHIRPAAAKGVWLPELCALLAAVQAAVPAGYRVLTMADEGLWSPTLFRQLQQPAGWAPLLRLHADTVVTTAQGRRQCPAQALVAGPGHAWVGRAVLFKTRRLQVQATVIVVWEVGHDQPWVLVTSLAPGQVGAKWYRMRAWIECGFRDLKALGWDWEHTRRRDCTRVARHWLVLAVATLWALAYGTRVEEQAQQGLPMGALPQRLETLAPAPLPPRTVSVFQRGVAELRKRLHSGRLWPELWLRYEVWPAPPAALDVTVCFALPPNLS